MANLVAVKVVKHAAHKGKWVLTTSINHEILYLVSVKTIGPMLRETNFAGLSKAKEFPSKKAAAKFVEDNNGILSLAK